MSPGGFISCSASHSIRSYVSTSHRGPVASFCLRFRSPLGLCGVLFRFPPVLLASLFSPPHLHRISSFISPAPAVLPSLSAPSMFLVFFHSLPTPGVSPCLSTCSSPPRHFSSYLSPVFVESPAAVFACSGSSRIRVLQLIGSLLSSWHISRAQTNSLFSASWWLTFKLYRVFK